MAAAVLSSDSAVTDKPSCLVCSEANKALLRCSRCKQAWYCSREHQKKDWKAHREKCLQFINSTGTKNEQALKTLKLGNGKEREQDACSSGVLSDRKANPKLENYQELYFPPSPMPSSLTSEETATRKEMVDLANYLVENLNKRGHCHVDNFLGADQADRVYNEVRALHSNDHMKEGQILAKSSAERIRGDKIAWVTGTEEDCSAIAFQMRKVDRLLRLCAVKLPELDVRGRTLAMVACYPGHGTAYKRHVDNPSGDGRCITTIYYLNKDWDVEKLGGQLRLYPYGRQEHTDIEPTFDRLLLFWSDRRNPHEVRPAHDIRYAITLWYFDAAERAKASREYYQSLTVKSS